LEEILQRNILFKEQYKITTRGSSAQLKEQYKITIRGSSAQLKEQYKITIRAVCIVPVMCFPTALLAVVLFCDI
jgi:hypothetical protein